MKIKTIRLMTTAFALLCMSLAVTANATVYYVGLNGSDSSQDPSKRDTPCATLTGASYWCHPGDSIYVLAGTYYIPVHQALDCKGTQDAHITIQPEPTATVILDGSRITGEYDVPLTLGGDYIDFQYFEIANAKAQGIYIWGGHHNRIYNCTIHDSYAAGVYIAGGAFAPVVDSCAIYHNCQNNNARTGSVWDGAISTYQASYVTLQNNFVYQNYGEGMIFDVVDQGWCLNNTVVDNYSVEIYLDDATNVLINKNLVYASSATTDTGYWGGGRPASGIRVANENGENPCANDTITNNIVLNGNAGFYYGDYLSGGGFSNFVVANNTFYGGTDAVVYIEEYAANKSKDVFQNNVFQNNIFYQTQASPLAINTATGSFTFDHNCWWTSSYVWDNASFYGNGDVWQNPLLINPGTTSAADYKLNYNSPCKDAGTYVPQVYDDYLGTTRVWSGTNIYDIGAWEYN